jgi:hypothetical protein
LELAPVRYGQGYSVLYNATLNGDGTIETQTLSKEFYNSTGGDTPYSYEPFNLKIYNCSGYQPYESNFTLSEATSVTIALQPEEGIATGFIFGGILTFLIMTVLGLAYIGKR